MSFCCFALCSAAAALSGDATEFDVAWFREKSSSVGVLVNAQTGIAAGKKSCRKNGNSSSCLMVGRLSASKSMSMIVTI